MLRVLVVGACLLLPALSFGANAPKEINIDADGVVEGRLDKPNLGDVKTRKPATFQSVIPVRQDFNEKVIRSVSEL